MHTKIVSKQFSFESASMFRWAPTTARRNWISLKREFYFLLYGDVSYEFTRLSIFNEARLVELLCEWGLLFNVGGRWLQLWNIWNDEFRIENLLRLKFLRKIQENWISKIRELKIFKIIYESRLETIFQSPRFIRFQSPSHLNPQQTQRFIDLYGSAGNLQITVMTFRLNWL